jgi:HD superfamily phosphodiesterase
MSWEKWYKVLLDEEEKYLKKAPDVSLSHKTDHILRVWEKCKTLCEKLDGDMEIMVAAVMLHDLGRHHGLIVHGEKSAELAEPILKKHGFPKQKMPMVLEAIAQHDYDFPREKRKLIESKILNDVDRIDSFGVVGVYKHILSINQGRLKLEEVIPASKKRWESLTLPESKKIAEADYKYIINFFEKLTKELNLC